MLHKLLLTLAFAILACAAPALAEPIYPPGLRVGLEPAAQLTLSKRLPGFEDTDRDVVVSILDLPAAAFQGLQQSAFKDQPGLEGVKRESFAFASGIGFLFTAHAKENGTTVHKWLLLATASGGAVTDLAMLVNVQVPEAARGVYTDDVIRKMLASVTFRPAPIAEQVAMLPFKVDDTAGFRVGQALPAGMILVDGPDNDLEKRPYLIVMIGRGGPDNNADRGRFAADMMRSTPLRDLQLTLSEPMRISGSAGYETRARATNPAGNPVTVVQWIRFGGSGFLRVVGVAPTDQWDAMFPRFRAVRDSVEPK
jgi:hypothetical protein